MRLNLNLRASKTLHAYIFLTPAIIFLVVFTVVPLLFGIYISFFRWNMLVPPSQAKFIGLENFRYILLQDERFIPSLLSTFYFTIGDVILTAVIALLVAVALNSNRRFRVFLRTIYFSPVITPLVAVSIVWSYIYHPNYGLLNELLSWVKLPPQQWLTSITAAMPSVIAMSVWKRLGYYMLIFLAGLQAVPQELFEAATVDGASKTTMFRRITLPLIKPTILFVLVVLTIEALQVFTQIYIMTQGGPVDATRVTVLYMYDTAFTYLRMGRASAMAFILFIIVLIVTFVQVRLMREGGMNTYTN